MRNPFLFFSDLAKQPLWVPVWVTILALANMSSLFFWSEPLAKAILITFMVSGMLMMALYSYFGYEKILGMGHVLWLFLLPCLVFHLTRVDGGFFLYLAALSVSLSISLVFDAIDIWKYFHDKRA